MDTRKSTAFSIALSLLTRKLPCTGNFESSDVVRSPRSLLSGVGSGNAQIPEQQSGGVTTFDRRLRKKRIVGGDRVVEGEYPFLALTKGRDVCGATLIHPDILLTAGHCSKYFGDGVTIGGILLDGTDGEHHNVDKILMHQDYPGSGPEPHDIALVKLSTTSSIRQNSAMARNAGSKWVSLRVPDFAACKARYPGKVIEELMFCTDTPNYDKDTCQGDSGEYGSPSVNTRVGSYIQWINEGICAMSDEKPDLCFTPAPVSLPTQAPVRKPTKAPTKAPARPPTKAPVRPPTKAPARPPTKAPTKAPIRPPTKAPTTKAPSTASPVQSPTRRPVQSPSKWPVRAPSTKAPMSSPKTEAPAASSRTIAPAGLKAFGSEDSAPQAQVAKVVTTTVAQSSVSPVRFPTKSPLWAVGSSKASLVQYSTQRPVQSPTKRPVPVAPGTKAPTFPPKIEAPVASSQSFAPGAVLEASGSEDSAPQAKVSKVVATAAAESPVNDRTESSVPIPLIENDAASLSNTQASSAVTFGASCWTILLLHALFALH